MYFFCFQHYGPSTRHVPHNQITKITQLGPGFISNPGAKNDSALESVQSRRDAELAAIITNNELASKNKGVFLPLSDETRSKVWQINEDRKQPSQ